MDPEQSIVGQLLKDLGLFTVGSLAVVAAVKWLFAESFKTVLSAKIDEGVQKRLSEYKHDLDGKLEELRSQYQKDLERLRSTLSREVADYSIWAQRRHDATSALFEALLRCEIDATDLSAHQRISTQSMSVADLIAFSSTRPRVQAKLTALIDAHGAGRITDCDRLVNDCLAEGERAQVVKARNDAYDAYFRYALYLSEAVDARAQEIRDFFHRSVFDKLK